MMNEQNSNHILTLKETEKFSTPCKELFDEIFYSKNLKQLIESNTKVKEKSKIQSGRSKSPKLNLYTYFKENCDSKPSSTKKVVNLTTTYFNPNQTNFKTITKFNNIEIESQILKSIVITDLIKVY